MRSSRPGRAHPRACGENHAQLMLLISDHGSSPRVRGKPCSHWYRPRRARLIPARAGKTSPKTEPRSPSAAHPRACGENWKDLADAAQKQGSSPRVRGKLLRGPDDPAPLGLIPARAGKTSSSPPAQSGTWAHPRACGENLARAAGLGGGRGSSPRVRGKLAPHVGAEGDEGLIPARAGKTRDQSPRPGSEPAHPRACGENITAADVIRIDGGSSPRVRGKRRDPLRRQGRSRLIPARAGKTCRSRRM